ncbi:coiled-coil domain-containing protein 62 [Pelobates fuscus]|uniref:coiled-coil domain-containing protein 62 n=1 Tax=Pelobates fuscus TaxID=191477 RepID=UPI002FE48E4A
MNSSSPLRSSPKLLCTDLENATIQKQRNELQLLIAELKDRDKELNDMVSVHRSQLLAWENDRQNILKLEQKCSRLENELQKRNEIIRSLTKRIKLMENQQQDRRTNLESTQQQLQELSFKAASECQDLEEKNQCLNDSVVELSSRIGRLQAREEELTTLLKLKDKDIIEATNHIKEFTSRFKDLEASLRETRNGEASAIKEAEELKPRLKGLKREIDKLKDILSQRTVENNEQREVIIRLKQEITYWQAEQAFTAEREKRKDQLILLAKSKQDRSDAELQNLRQVYMKQHNDLQFLHLTLESSQNLMQNLGQKADTSDGSLDLNSSSLRTPEVDGNVLNAQNLHDNLLSELKLPLTQSTLKDSVFHRSQKSSSPTLHRLLAESRQMVADLELSMVLPAPYNSPRNHNEQVQPTIETSQETHQLKLNRNENTSGFS